MQYPRHLPRIGIGIASAGRRDQLRDTLAHLQHQCVKPDRVIVCPASASDVDARHLASMAYPSQIVASAKGLPSQRNAILNHATDLDILIFFDDDFYPAKSYVSEALNLFHHHADVVAATGDVLADGKLGPGLTHAEGMALLQEDELKGRPGLTQIKLVYNAYGCNMAVRMAAVMERAIWFDENLPLYGWLEDVDFCGRLRAHGHIVHSNQLRGVHLAVKAGRTSGLRLGYSQIANPIYLVKKGSYPLWTAVGQVSRNVSKNMARSLWPEPWVDRLGRLRGNVLALRDLARGRLHPARILDIDVRRT